MFGSALGNSGGVTTTGLDDVDLWVGGLAEMTNNVRRPARQHLQLRLPDTDGEPAGRRPAVLPAPHARHEPAHPARGQLVRRADPAQHRRHQDSKADVFATADCKFSIGVGARTRPRPMPLTGGGDRRRRPEHRVRREPAAAAQARRHDPVPPGQQRSIRPASTVRPSTTATASVDRICGGNDNDTFWGGDGNDIIEGNGGDDVALGGDGNDIITDLSGADVVKGGPGNDAIDVGTGDDIIMGGDGSDFINGGANDNEPFAGRATTSSSPARARTPCFGDGGDDWIEGGTGQDLLQGDHGAPFFDDILRTKAAPTPARWPRRLRRQRSGRTTTTQRAATTSCRRTPTSSVLPDHGLRLGHSQGLAR